MLEGRDASGLYDDESFRGRTRSIGTGAETFITSTPPTAAMVMAPLAVLDYRSARTVWIVVSYLLLVAGGTLLALRLKLSDWKIVVLASLPFFFEPVAANFEHGQMYVLVAFLLAAGLEAYRARRMVYWALFWRFF